MSSASAKASAKVKLARVRAKLSIMATFQAALTASRNRKSENQPTPKSTCSIPESWKESFENLLADEKGRLAFLKFLEREHSEENMHFWMACTNYSQITDNQRRVSTAQNIYNQHLDVNSPEPVNVDSGALVSVRAALVQPTEHTFLLAQKQIFVLMKTDSYRRFISAPADQCRCTCGVHSPSSRPKSKGLGVSSLKLPRKSGSSPVSSSPRISPNSSLAALDNES